MKQPGKASNPAPRTRIAVLLCSLRGSKVGQEAAFEIRALFTRHAAALNTLPGSGALCERDDLMFHAVFDNLSAQGDWFQRFLRDEPRQGKGQVVCLHNVSAQPGFVGDLLAGVPRASVWTDVLTRRRYGPDGSGPPGIELAPFQTLWLLARIRQDAEPVAL